MVKTSNVSNCYNLGTITSNAINGAGIIGVVYNSEDQKVTINRCYNEGNINIERLAGGITGYGLYMQIQDCYNKGNVTGNFAGTGGITGWASQNCLIINCYNIGNVTKNIGISVGGILGSYDGSELPTLTNCYHLNTSSVYAAGDANGGWGTLGDDWEGHIEVKTDEDMKALAGTLGENWSNDINNINNGYPVLKWQLEE